MIITIFYDAEEHSPLFVVNVADICCQLLARAFRFKVSGKHVVVDVSFLFIKVP